MDEHRREAARRRGTGTIAIALAILALAAGATNAWAAVRGRALLLDAPDRGTPGNLFLGVINGPEGKFERLAEGQIVDARFSPDGQKVVYGVGGTIKILDLKTHASQDVGSYEAPFTYFNWTLDNRILWSDGQDLRQIFALDIATKKKAAVHKGNAGRTTISLDGTRAAWVIPPVCAVIGGKQYGYMGGCGGAVSPSGKYLTSNLTTTHRLMGIFTFDENGPSAKPIRTVVGPANGAAINGFYFGRTDDWVCYVTESKSVNPTSYICYWRTGDYIQVGETKKYCIKDFFDETDVVPEGATLEGIAVCSEGPTNTPLTHEMLNVAASRPFKVVGTYKTKDGDYTPQVRSGVTWKADASKVELAPASITGKAESGRITVTAEYQGKQASFDVTVLPELTGDGFQADYFTDTAMVRRAVTRIDPYIDFTWEGNGSPDPSIDGRVPWSVRWTGMMDVQTAGEYTFSFLQGEGNDRFIKGEGDAKTSAYSVRVDGKLMISLTKNWNYPWDRPKASEPMVLEKGLHAIEVTTVDTSAHPVVAQLYWSGPGIRTSLLGGGSVHSNARAASSAAIPARTSR